MPEPAADARAAFADSVAAGCAGRDPRDALRRAVAADATVAVAAADLAAWTGTDVAVQRLGATPWERRHLEIVQAAATDPSRAEALLRDHAARSGCDPLALLIVAPHVDGMDGLRLADLRGRECTCWPERQLRPSPKRHVSATAPRQGTSGPSAICKPEAAVRHRLANEPDRLTTPTRTS